jgi:hypothetical protein
LAKAEEIASQREKLEGARSPERSKRSGPIRKIAQEK